MNPTDLNKIIHEPVRLGILSALMTRETLTFPELKEMLKVTDGRTQFRRYLEELEQLLHQLKG